MNLQRYRDLVTVSVDLDTSALQDKLDEIEGGLDEDRVSEIVREALSDAGLDDLSGTYVESDDLDGAIQSVLDNTDFESRISSLESLNTCGVDLNDLADIPQRVEALETSVENLDNDALDELTVQVDAVDDRLGGVDQRLQALEEAGVSAMVDRVEDLETALTGRVVTLEGEVGLLNERLAALEDKLDALSSESARGLTLLDLLTQAARLLGILH